MAGIQHMGACIITILPRQQVLGFGREKPLSQLANTCLHYRGLEWNKEKKIDMSFLKGQIQKEEKQSSLHLRWRQTF